MLITRRDFLAYCSSAAAAVGLSKFELKCLASAVMDPSAPTVLWLQGASCTGCTVSLANRISSEPPVDIAEVLIDVINLAYHPTLMAAAGQTAIGAAEQAFNAGGYVLAVEGGVPTAFGGNACWAWTDRGVDVTFQEAVTQLAERAVAIISVGQCAAYGGIPAAGPNPTGVESVATITGRETINVPGCPPHPDWIVWVIAQLVAGNAIDLDGNGRPQILFNDSVHDNCPLRGTEEATAFGQEDRCLKKLGCRGPQTDGFCPDHLWNGAVSWCVAGGAPCIGCTDPGFPKDRAFFKFVN